MDAYKEKQLSISILCRSKNSVLQFAVIHSVSCSEAQWYNETLRVVTDIRTCYKEVNLVANGTLNQKFYCIEDA